MKSTKPLATEAGGTAEASIYESVERELVDIQRSLAWVMERNARLIQALRAKTCSEARS